jgi:hypothetical protein
MTEQRDAAADHLEVSGFIVEPPVPARRPVNLAVFHPEVSSVPVDLCAKAGTAHRHDIQASGLSRPEQRHREPAE